MEKGTEMEQAWDCVQLLPTKKKREREFDWQLAQDVEKTVLLCGSLVCFHVTSPQSK